MSDLKKITVYRHWKKPREIFAEVVGGLAFHKKGDPIIITGKFAGEYVVQSVDEKLGKSYGKPLPPNTPKPKPEDRNKHNPDREQQYIKEVLLAPAGEGLDIKKYYRRAKPITIKGV